MSAITRIDAYIATDERTPKGANPLLYLALAGREFHLHSHDEAARLDTGGEYTYVLGEDANITDPQINDPRKPQLTTEGLAVHPAYLRVVPHPVFRDWVLDRITVTIKGADETIVYDNFDLAGPETFVHLGPDSGLYSFLTRV